MDTVRSSKQQNNSQDSSQQSNNQRNSQQPQKSANTQTPAKDIFNQPITQQSQPAGTAMQKSGTDVSDMRKKFEEMKQKKKEKIDNMKSFLNLKRKIYSLINMGKPEEARSTYDTLYVLYQNMLKTHTPQELVVIKNAISEVYAELEQSINKKKVKKGHFTEVELKKDEKTKRTKVVTTDLDVIMQLVEEKGKLNLADIQARFNVSRKLAEEWIQILADYGLVEIKYLPIGGVEITKIK